MSTYALLLVALTVVAWIGTFRMTVNHPLDGMAILLYLTGYHFIFRPLVLASGLDTPFPTDIFASRDSSQLVVTTQLLILLWFAALTLGNRALIPASRLFALGVPRPPAEMSSIRLLRVSVALTAIATVATLATWRQLGGFEALLQASKGEREVGSRALRLFPFVATITSAAAYLEMVRDRHLGRSVANPHSHLLALALVVLNAVFSFSWGARDSAVFGLICILVGHVLITTDTSDTAHNKVVKWWSTGGRKKRLAIILGLVLALTFSLRVYRDVLIRDEVASSIDGEGTFRQVAVATNNAYYDALLLVVDEWPDTYQFRGGEDFWNAALTSLPSVIAANPDADPPSIIVAQTFVPTRKNGWPVTPLGDWYLAFGALGVLVGGVLSGMFARSIQMRLTDFATNPLSWAILIIFMGTVYPMGFWVFSFTRYVTLGIPMVALAMALRLTSPQSHGTASGIKQPERRRTPQDFDAQPMNSVQSRAGNSDSGRAS